MRHADGIGTRGLRTLSRRGGLGLLVTATAVAGLLWWRRPVPGGTGYELGLEVAATLLLIWLAWRAGAAAMHRRAVLLAAAAVGVAGGGGRLLGLDERAEVVGTYRTLFAALDAGLNPYSCRCVLHLTDAGARLGDFNYPPGEIWPYRALELAAGHWDVWTLATATAALNLIGFAAVYLAVPRGRATWLLPFAPLVVLWELRATVGMTLLLIGGIAAVLIRQASAPAPWQGWVLRVLFGVALVTKFAALPVFAAWWWWTAFHGARSVRDADRRGRLTALRDSAADLLVPVAIAWVALLPFGAGAVLRSTLLFNLALDRREELTTFYPNVVSGLARWWGAGGLYPLASVALVGLAVLIAPRLRPIQALLLALTVFLLAAPTPEPQFTPVAVLLLLAALVERDLGREPRPSPGHRHGPGVQTAGRPST